MYIVLAILAFGILIAVHELGHFCAAKSFGVRVEEFALGMGPKLLKKQGKETLYTLRALPFGGFCSMTGEDGDDSDPRSFAAAKLWKKIIILFSGPFMNFLIGYILVLLVFSGAAAYSTPVLEGFMDGCPYQGEEALQIGDEFYSIDGHRTWFRSDVTQYLAESGEDIHDIVVKRGGKRVKLKSFELSLHAYTDEDGTEHQYYGFLFGYTEGGVMADLRYSWYQTLDFVRTVWESLKMLVNRQAGITDLSGPVGIVDSVNEVAKSSPTVAEAIENLLYYFALIAVNLAVMNLLPIPALDGGHIFTLLITALIELILRRKIDPKYESWIHTAGLILLMGLMVFILFHDVWRIIFQS